jgi:hypothetical protein
MTTNLASVLTSIFLVVRNSGSYEDRITTFPRAFTSQAEAQSFAKDQYQAFVRLGGISTAVSNMMAAWSEANPSPDDPIAYGVWSAREVAERDRVEALTGYALERDALGIAGWASPYEVSHHVVEVPVGKKDTDWRSHLIGIA